MDVVRLVVEPQRWGCGSAEAQVGLRHLDRQVKRLVVPPDVSGRGKVLGPGVRFLAAAILVLELEPQRLAGIEPVARAVKRRRPIDAQRRANRRLGEIELDQWLKRRLGIPRAAESYAPRRSGDLPAQRGRRVAVHPACRFDLDDAAFHPYTAHERGCADRLEHRHEPDAAPSRAQQVERCARAAPRQPRSFGAEQLSFKQKERRQRSAIGCQLEGYRSLRLGSEALGARRELILQLGVLPPSPRHHVAAPLEVPRQLEQMILATRQLDDVEQVRWAGHHCAGDIAVAAARPAPVARRVEGLTHGVPPAGRTVQPRRVVCQGRAVPQEITRHVRPGADVGEPVHTVSVERQMQPVRVPVPAAEWAALQAHVALPRTQHRKALRIEQRAAGDPGRRVGRKLRQHL